MIPFLRSEPPWLRNELWRRARMVPSLDLDFANTQSLVDRISGLNLVTFTRASAGSRVTASGGIESLANDVPRFTFDSVTGRCLGLLPEEARTNLLLRSEEFDNASWVKSNSSISANVGLSPGGGSTADKLIEDSAMNTHHLQQSVSHTSGVTYTASCYVKAAERTFFSIAFGAGFTGSQQNAFFDLSGVSTPTTGASIAPLADGWRRCTFTVTATATATSSVQLRLATSSSVANYTGNGASGILIWGAQLEAGAFPTSYIGPTTGSTMTRAADIATITGSNFSRWYNQSEGTMFVQAVPVGTSGNGLFGADDGTTAERLRIGHTGVSSAGGVVSDNSSVVVNMTSPAGTAALNSTMRAAFGYRLNDFHLAANGSLSASPDTSGTLPTVTQATIGTASTASYNNGPIARITYWPRRLPDHVLQELTR